MPGTPAPWPAAAGPPSRSQGAHAAAKRNRKGIANARVVACAARGILARSSCVFLFLSFFFGGGRILFSFVCVSLVCPMFFLFSVRLFPLMFAVTFICFVPFACMMRYSPVCFMFSPFIVCSSCDKRLLIVRSSAKSSSVHPFCDLCVIIVR